MPPVRACAPSGDVCAAPAVSGLVASYRKDAWLPDYDEAGTAPTVGGRLQIAGTAAASGTVTRVLVDGVDPEDIYTPSEGPPPFDWYHVWPREAVAGEPLWVAFHSRDAKWDGLADAELVVETTGGDALRGRFPVATTPVPLTYVTTDADRAELLVHLQNRDGRAHTLRRLRVNARDVTAQACLGATELAPGEATLLRVPFCSVAAAGDAWTVAVDFDDAPTAVGVGRVLPERFIVEAWPSGSDCAFPGANDANFERHRRAGFDTLYMYWGGSGRCGFDGATMANVTAPATPELNILVGDDFLQRPSPETAITDPSAIVGFLTGDESDGEIDDEDGIPRPAKKADDARRLWSMYPGLPVYNGGKTNKNVGAFAGMTDVQGMDLYIAACAPHITRFGSHPPIDGAFDYLRNTRENHMPSPTWLYAQGLSGVWNQERPLIGGEIHVQPDPQEILLQAFHAIAAGAKGLMWFQTSLEEADHAPRRWDAIADANWMVRAVRERLRVGDPTGAATASGAVLVEAIRAGDAIVVPVVNHDTTATVDDFACAASFVSEGSVPHWELATITSDVEVSVPPDFGVRDVFEVTPRGVAEVRPSVSGRRVRLRAPLSNATPVRLFVLAADEAARGDALAALAARP